MSLHTRKGLWVAAALSALFFLPGCWTVGPDYVPQTVSVSPQWNSTLGRGLTTAGTDGDNVAKWWTTLGDPDLCALMGRAVSGNLDLRKAWSRVREARAQRGVREAGAFPTLEATGSVGRSGSGEKSGGGRENDLYSAGFDARWELDVFGGVRRLVEAAEADLAASRENLNDLLVSLTAEVALNYVEARTFQARLWVAQANLAIQQQTFELIQWRHQAGLSDELALQQARYNLESTRSHIPNLRTGLEQAKNRLAVLTGQPPGAVHAVLARERPVPVTPPTVAVGVPAETVRRRPDIRRAERELAAQTARIGVAVADLYPKFRLTGSIGLESIRSDDLFQAASRVWRIGPSISWNIFDAGAIRRNIEVQSVRQEQYLIAYELTVLSALEEVENTLTAYVEEHLRRERLSDAVNAARRAVELSQDRYKAGLVGFSNVLDAQRSLLSFQDQLAQSDGTATSNLVRLYKALGGGWTPLAITPAAASKQ